MVLAPRRTMCTAPASLAPASSSGAPTTRSTVPSRSRSPTSASEEPKKSLVVRRGPLTVRGLISTVRFTEPFELRSTRWTAPSSVTAEPFPRAPTTMSGAPSRSRSPTEAADEPKKSLAARDGPLAVEALISAVLFTEPSELR